VKAGEADAVLADKSFLSPIAEADGELSLVAQEVMIGGGIGIGMRQSDEDLKAKFDAAIVSMKEDGSLNKLIGKWLPEAGLFE
jgi:polar amino acid transport system substrate-binding protein